MWWWWSLRQGSRSEVNYGEHVFFPHIWLSSYLLIQYNSIKGTLNSDWSIVCRFVNILGMIWLVIKMRVHSLSSWPKQSVCLRGCSPMWPLVTSWVKHMLFWSFRGNAPENVCACLSIPVFTCHLSPSFHRSRVQPFNKGQDRLFVHFGNYLFSENEKGTFEKLCVLLDILFCMYLIKTPLQSLTKLKRWIPLLFCQKMLK